MKRTPMQQLPYAVRAMRAENKFAADFWDHAPLMFPTAEANEPADCMLSIDCGYCLDAIELPLGGTAASFKPNRLHRG